MIQTLSRLLQLSCLALLVPAGWCHAQSQGHLDVHVEVLPAVLRVTVTSALVDFGQQRADAGVVLLDPVTGEISRAVGGRHQLGVVHVTGRAGTHFAVSVEAPRALQGEYMDIGYGLTWAQSADCGGRGYTAISHHHAFSGQLGEGGQACLRFGGALDLQGVRDGRYAGAVQVRLSIL